MNVGFIGLGRMGRGMAANLLSSGHGVTVYNRTASDVNDRARLWLHHSSLMDAGAKVHHILIQRIGNNNFQRIGKQAQRWQFVDFDVQFIRSGQAECDRLLSDIWLDTTTDRMHADRIYHFIDRYPYL